MKTKKQFLFLLLLGLLFSVGNVWGATTLFTTDFTDSKYNVTYPTTTSGSITIDDNGTQVKIQGYKSKAFVWSSTDGITCTSNNISVSEGDISETNPNFFIAIPVSGIVCGIINVITTGDATKWYYAYTTNAEKTQVSERMQAAANGGFTITGLSTDAIIYIGSSGKKIKTITITTPELADLTESAFYSTYANSSKSAAQLIEGASFPSYISINSCTNADNGNNNTSTITTPHDFSSLASGTTYYRLKPSSSSSIVIGALSHVRSIRVYGNGSGSTGSMKTSVTKLSGTGTAMTVSDNSYLNSKATIVEYSTGDLTALAGYDENTYYLYTITFTGNFSLWGIYVEYAKINTVSFVAGDHGTYTGEDIAQASIGASIALPALTTLETGYNFNGWFTASSEGDFVGAADAPYTPAADITLYAQYSARSYSIKLDDNGGTEDGSATATYNSNKLTSITDPTWAGKAVVGYYKEAGSSNLIADAEGNLQKNTDYTDASGNWNHDAAVTVTLYAKWSTSHTVTAASNNNTYGTAEAAETSVAEGETTTITASANDGYKFRSWAVSGEGSTLSSNTENPTTLTMGTANATVTATFSALEHYTITYNKGAYGAGDDIAAGDKTEDVAFALSSTRYTRVGYVQTGWALTDGGDKAYDLGGSYTENADLVLYPFWTALDVQTDVTGAATWDWNDFTSGEINLTGPIVNTDIVFSNISKYGYTVSADAAFKQQSLLVNCQYAWRNANGSKFMQGNKAQFNTTVLGTVTIEYANTGSNPKRTVVVNGTWGTKTSSANNSYQSESFETEAETITITGVQTETVENNGTAGDPKMLRIRKIVFTPASHSITATPDYYATFCAPYKVSVPDGVEAYTARYSTIGEYTGLLTLDAWTNGGRRVIPANLPVILKGTSTSFVLTATDAEVDDFVGTNNLHGTPSAALDASTVSTAYVLGVVEDLTGFYKKESGEIPVNKAYLIIDGGAAAAPQVIRIVEGENGATSIGSIEQTKQAVKFVENGRILIKKNGIVYDTLGRIVK